MKDSYLFADESGHIQTDRYFLVGVLRVPGDWRHHEKAIEEICGQFGYQREIKYAKADHLAIPVKKAIIDWAMDSDVFFRCLVKDLMKVDLSYYEPNEGQRGISKEELFFNHSYGTVVRQCLRRPESFALLMDQKSRREGDNCMNYMSSLHPRCAFVGEGDSKKYRLLQVVDLLTGCVNGDLNGTQAKPKREVIDHLKGRLGVQSLANTCRHHRANIWHWEPPK